jgi:hypothetical protein
LYRQLLGVVVGLEIGVMCLGAFAHLLVLLEYPKELSYIFLWVD